MRTTADFYTLRPRKQRNGWTLESNRLSHGLLWYANETDAISYAKWHSRVKGCKIDVLNDEGQIIRTEEISPGDFAY